MSVEVLPTQKKDRFERQVRDLGSRVGELEQINEGLHDQLDVVLRRNELLTRGVSSFNSLTEVEQNQYIEMTGIAPTVLESNSQSNTNSGIDYDQLQSVMQDVYTQKELLIRGAQNPESLNDAEKEYYQELVGKEINNTLTDTELQVRQQAFEEQQQQLGLVLQKIAVESQNLRGQNGLLLKALRDPNSLNEEEIEVFNAMILEEKPSNNEPNQSDSETTTISSEEDDLNQSEQTTNGQQLTTNTEQITDKQKIETNNNSDEIIQKNISTETIKEEEAESVETDMNTETTTETRVNYDDLENVMQDIYTQNEILIRGAKNPESLNDAERKYYEELVGSEVNQQISDPELQVRQQALEERQQQLGVVLQQIANENQNLRGQNGLLLKAIRDPNNLTEEEVEIFNAMVLGEDLNSNTPDTEVNVVSTEENNSNQQLETNTDNPQPVTNEQEVNISNSYEEVDMVENNTQTTTQETITNVPSAREMELENALKMMQQQNQQLMIGMNLLARAAQNPGDLNDEERAQYQAITGVSLMAPQEQIFPEAQPTTNNQQLTTNIEETPPEQIVQNAVETTTTVEPTTYRSSAPEMYYPEEMNNEYKPVHRTGFNRWIHDLLPTDSKSPLSWLAGVGGGVAESVAIAGLFGPGAALLKTGINALVLDRVNADKQHTNRRSGKNESGLMSGIAAGALGVAAFALAGELADNPLEIDYWDDMDLNPFDDWDIFDQDDIDYSAPTASSELADAESIMYEVQEGDTVWDILIDHGIEPTDENIEDIVVLNADEFRSNYIAGYSADNPNRIAALESYDDIISGNYDREDIMRLGRLPHIGDNLIITDLPDRDGIIGPSFDTGVSDTDPISSVPETIRTTTTTELLPEASTIATAIPETVTIPENVDYGEPLAEHIKPGHTDGVEYGEGILAWHYRNAEQTGLTMSDLVNGFTFDIKTPDGKIVGYETIEHTAEGWDTQRYDENWKKTDMVLTAGSHSYAIPSA